MKMYIYELYVDNRRAIVIDKSSELASLRAHARDPRGNWKNSSPLRLCKIKKQKYGRILALEQAMGTVDWNKE